MVQKFTSQCPLRPYMKICVFLFVGLWSISASKAYKFKIMQTYSSADEIVIPSLQQLTLLFNRERGHCNWGREVSTTEKATYRSFLYKSFIALSQNFPCLRISWCAAVVCTKGLRFQESAEEASISLLQLNASCPWDVSFQYKADLDTHWYIHVKQFLGVSNEI